MKTIRLVITLGLVLPAAAAFGLDGEEILQASDAKLLPPNCTYNLTLDTVEDDGTRKVNVLDGQKKGNARNVMLVTRPPKVSGSVHMRKELVIWSYYVTDRKTVKEAYSSIFMGSLLNYGDVMATELSYDYDVVATQETTEHYILTLAPKPDHEGYARVVVTVNKDDLVPVKREYFALSGELMKTAEIIELRRAGRRNSEETVYMQQRYYEPLKDRYSIATYSSIRYVQPNQIPDRYFDENQIRYFGS